MTAAGLPDKTVHQERTKECVCVCVGEGGGGAEERGRLTDWHARR